MKLEAGTLIYFYQNRIILPIADIDDKWAFMWYYDSGKNRHKFKTKLYASDPSIITVITMNVTLGPAKVVTPDEANELRRTWAMDILRAKIKLVPLAELERWAAYAKNLLPQPEPKRKKG